MVSSAIGTVTRGTTNTNRLRRIDRWIAQLPVLRHTDDPLVVDLGFGASAVTTLELSHRLRSVRDDVEIIGLEIDTDRVQTARGELGRVRAGLTGFDPHAPVSFEYGGFELGRVERAPAVIRAFNVLRQYEEGAVATAWTHLRERLQPGGALVEGTCDELGRVASWVTLDPSGPVTFTLSLRLSGLETTRIVAERLPKALIHHNVPGQPVHTFLSDLERLWQVHAPLGTYGVRQRWLAVASGMRANGWPVRGGRTRWRLGELSVDWNCVAPL